MIPLTWNFWEGPEKKSSVGDVRECFSYWTWDLDFWEAAGGDLGRQ